MVIGGSYVGFKSPILASA